MRNTYFWWHVDFGIANVDVFLGRVSPFTAAGNGFNVFFSGPAVQFCIDCSLFLSSRKSELWFAFSRSLGSLIDGSHAASTHFKDQFRENTYPKWKNIVLMFLFTALRHLELTTGMRLQWRKLAMFGRGVVIPLQNFFLPSSLQGLLTP